ncbi:MAG: undecaprenyldiphospho-muramoylpentapeptide beta-N-acetylglucosaminyltransferase [Gammaproteobacteria bacterium]|nr:undecaprenyldiphospho-muramoylpentapeptide beta-N-acetylglucosaminyltransferase [Gammaproteobacteria bacterium]
MVAANNILIMAGGTGGHVFPALAVARYLRNEGVEVTWLGTRRGLESRVVPEAGFPIEYISITGLRGRGLLGWLLAPFRLTAALWQALQVCLRCRPGVVLGLGGFVTGPGGVAAWLLRRPLVIHEQNAIAGLTNRLLSRLARRVLEAFPGSFPQSIKTEQTGNPIRAEICDLPIPEKRIAAHQAELRILVIGGSLGAQALNEVLPQAIALLPSDNRPAIWHQAGQNKDAATRQAYANANVEVRVEPFIADMAEAYSWADLVICRAGALTISELAAAGVGAILVPYPHAVDDHQTRNALYLTEAGAARLILQAELNPEVLANVLHDLLSGGREGLVKMATAARQLAKPKATRQVAETCLEVMHG